MTREEEINNASYAYWVNNYANIEFIDEEEKELHTQDIQESFINGAEWADQHPHWISIEDSLPKEHQWFLGYSPMKYAMLVDVYNFDSNGLIEAHGITHWMPLPQAPTVAKNATVKKKGGKQ